MWYLSSWRDLRWYSNAGHGLWNKPEITPPSHSNHHRAGTRTRTSVLTGAVQIGLHPCSSERRPCALICVMAEAGLSLVSRGPAGGCTERVGCGDWDHRLKSRNGI